MREIVTSDIGGTHARFALADIDGGRVVSVDEPVILETADYASFRTAWEEFGRRKHVNGSTGLALAFAGPVEGDVLKLTNSRWVIRPSLFREWVGVHEYTIVNDLGAVAHAVATLGDRDFRDICGPPHPLPREGVVSIVGPGTGLGVAALLRRNGHYEVIETEGGHIDFAPLDSLDDKILVELRLNFGRVSVERVASGRGLWNIYEKLGAIEGRPLLFHEEKKLWDAALTHADSLASAALDRLCMILGGIAGDMALAQGASAVVIAGGVGLRLADYLEQSGFRDRFIAKGRFERRMEEIPVKLITHPEPGLYGAASAFAREHS